MLRAIVPTTQKVPPHNDTHIDTISIQN